MKRRIVILTEGHTDPLTAKTAASVIRYRGDEVLALLDSTRAGATSQELLGVGGDTPVVARLADVPRADMLLIGIAPTGGRIPPSWRSVILEAIAQGLSIISGLHDFVSDDPEFVSAAERTGSALIDLRKNEVRHVARQQGLRAECLRIHTVGTDCSVGKMVTAIETTRELLRRGHDAKFVATGQTGIMIEGDGCPIDCVVADFISGAAEQLVLANQQHEILLIEGQGSLYHPSYSGVTLGLLHGCQPHGLILCYEAQRDCVRGLEHRRLPCLPDARQLFEAMASIMHPSRVIGIAMNGRCLSPAEAKAEGDRVGSQLGLPVCDVLRDDAAALATAIVDLKRELSR